jgi:hypothetical protein
MLFMTWRYKRAILTVVFSLRVDPVCWCAENVPENNKILAYLSRCATYCAYSSVEKKNSLVD